MFKHKRGVNKETAGYLFEELKVLMRFYKFLSTSNKIK